MTVELPDISDIMVERLVNEINTRGYAQIEHYIDKSTLRSMQGFVADTVRRSGKEYVALTGAAPVADTALADIARSDRFQALMRRLYTLGTGGQAPAVNFYQVLRCLCGRQMRKHSWNFHYDSYVVTALIPVEIPAGGTHGQSGDLVMLPNFRRVRASYLANVLDKLLLDNALTQFALRKLVRHNLLKLTRIKPVPGNIYFFWGYRSIHTNEPCDLDKVRATALYHYANPHAVRSAQRGARFAGVSTAAPG